MALPPSAAFLDSIRPQDLDNHTGLSMTERALLLTVMRLYFGVAQGAGAVKDVSQPASLAELDHSMRDPGERFDLLEQQTSLPVGFFSGASASLVAPAVARRENGEYPASYFVYEQAFNVVLYVGPDFFHGLADRIVVNCLTLDERFRPTASFTLRP
jgi:hypothetical protein